MNSSTERSATEAPERLTCSETGVALALALGEQLEGADDDPAVELLDHAGALRGLDEGGGRQQLAVVAGHPQQQLVALDPARGEAADRLGVKAEAVVGERVADPRRWSSGGARGWRCGSSGSWKRAIWLRPSSLARYIAWSAATSTASAPIPRSPPNIVMPTLIVAGSASGVGGDALGDLGAQVLAELQRARRCRSAASAPRTRRRRGGRRCRWRAPARA